MTLLTESIIIRLSARTFGSNFRLELSARTIMIRISMSCTSMTFYIKIHRSVNPWLPGTNAPPIASGCRSASWSAMPPPIENPFINLFRQKGSEESCFENWLKQESIGSRTWKPSPPLLQWWFAEEELQKLAPAPLFRKLTKLML